MLHEYTLILQKYLNGKGFKLTEDGELGPITLGAVLTLLGIKPISAPVPPADKSGEFRNANLAAIAEREAKRNLVWTPTSEATKYTNLFKSIFGSGRYAWCGTFVFWCCREAGLNIPLKPAGLKYTFALVETWQEWFKEKGFYHDNDGKFIPQAGDVVMFDWDQKSIDQSDSDWEDHIGIFLRMEGSFYVCAEGNTSNMTAVRKRSAITIQGFGRIPVGYKFA